MPLRTGGIEDQIVAIFKDLIFMPLVRVVKKTTTQALPTSLQNAEDPLRQALKSGRIQYTAGKFTGEFSAAISRRLRALGATFDSRTKTYSLPASRVPSWVSAEAGAYAVSARAAHDEMVRALDDIQKNFNKALETKSLPDTMAASEVEKGFEPVAKKLQVLPELSVTALDQLKQDYTNNLRLSIKKFADEEVPKLRAIVEDNALEGYRFAGLIKKFQARFGVSESRARFLAQQETALFMSKYRAQRFMDGGITHYRWSTSHDEKVRDGTNGPGNHKALNGKVFSYKEKAPAGYMSCGQPCNPGEDFRCRCGDIPIVEPLAKMVTED